MAKRFGQDGFYGTQRWKRARASAVRRDLNKPCPICKKVLVKGQRFAVDHSPRRRDLDPTLWYDPKFLQTLHWDCHNREKQAMESNDHMPQIGLDGFPDGWR